MLYVPENRKVPGVDSAMSSFVAEKHAKELPVECQEVPLELLGSSAYGRKFQLQEAGVSDWDCH